MIRLCVLDCDGTLVDSQHVIVAAMADAWGACGRAVPPDADAVRRVVGLSLDVAIGRLAPDGDGDALAALADGYRQAFRRLHQDPALIEPLFPGVAEALDAAEAAGFLLGIATGKGRRGLQASLERHGLLDRFVTLQTADDAAGKPAPDMLLRAMAETGADPACTVMVGDTTFDMIMARAARVPAVGVSWGYHGADELSAAGAAVVIDSFDALAAALAGPVAAGRSDDAEHGGDRCAES